MTAVGGGPALVLFVGSREIRLPLPNHGSIIIGAENLQLAAAEGVSPMHLRVQADRTGLIGLKCTSDRGLHVLEGGEWRATQSVPLRALPLSVRLGARVVAQFARVEGAGAISDGISRTFQKDAATELVASLEGTLDQAALRLAVGGPGAPSRGERLCARVDVMVTARLLYGVTTGRPADLAPCLRWVPLLDPRSGLPLRFRSLEPGAAGADFELELPHGVRVIESARVWRRVRDAFRDRHLQPCVARLDRLAQALGSPARFGVSEAGRHHHHELRLNGRLSVSPAIAVELLGDGFERG